MADWQARLLFMVCCSMCMWCCLQTQMQTGHQHVQITARQSAWLAGKQPMPMLVQSVLQHMHVVFKAYNS